MINEFIQKLINEIINYRKELNLNEYLRLAIGIIDEKDNHYFNILKRNKKVIKKECNLNNILLYNFSKDMIFKKKEVFINDIKIKLTFY